MTARPLAGDPAYAPAVAGDAPAHGEIDWTTASVQDATLTVDIAGEPGKEWCSRLQEIIERLDRPHSAWGEVEVKRSSLRAGDLTAGCEPDLRHLLESAVLQVNSEFAPDPEDDASGNDARTELDREMTAAFRAFAGEGENDEDA